MMRVLDFLNAGNNLSKVIWVARTINVGVDLTIQNETPSWQNRRLALFPFHRNAPPGNTGQAYGPAN